MIKINNNKIFKREKKNVLIFNCHLRWNSDNSKSEGIISVVFELFRSYRNVCVECAGIFLSQFIFYRSKFPRRNCDIFLTEKKNKYKSIRTNKTTATWDGHENESKRVTFKSSIPSSRWLVRERNVTNVRDVYSSGYIFIYIFWLFRIWHKNPNTF